MKLLLFLMVGCGFFLGVAPATARAQSMPEMREQAAEELATADAELNKLYQELLRKHAGDKTYITNLKDAQRSWLAFVELHIKTVYPIKEGENPGMVYGSMYAIDYAVTKAELIKQRIKQLQFLLGKKL